jgi:uncharacterized protein
MSQGIAPAAPARPPETKSLPVELKAVGDDGSFVMYGAAFGNVDEGGDVIEPGAFSNLDLFVKDGWIAHNHKGLALPVGYPTSAIQDARGLRVEGSFHSHPEAQALRQVVKERFAAGKTVKASIGYRTVKAAAGVRDGRPVRLLQDVQLYEVSFVNLPMNPQADVVSAKGANTETTEEGTVPETEIKGGILDAFKELFGLVQRKAAEGKMSKSGMTRLKAFAEAMHEHGETSREHAKCLHEHGKAACALGKEMSKFLKDYDPEEADVDEDDEEEEVTSDRKPKKKPGKGRKDEEPEDSGDGNPPKSAAELYRETLRHRALTGRGSALVP